MPHGRTRRASGWRGLLGRSGLQSCDRVGTGVRVHGTLHVSNPGRMEIGDGVRIDARVASTHLVTGKDGRLSVGDRVHIGHGSGVAAHRQVTIGPDAVIGPFALIMDTDFHEAGQRDAAGASSAIHIGAGARLGARVTVLRGASIGDGAVVAAGSVVTGVVAAGAEVAGNPARPPQAEHGAEPTAMVWQAVAEVVRGTLGLAVAPEATARPADVPQWDSLGALNVLIALEGRFGVSLDAEALMHINVMGDILPVLHRGVVRQPRA